MNKSNYLRNGLLNHVTGGSALPQPAGLWLALSTTTINPDGTGLAEPGFGYSRQAVSWGAVAGGSVANNAAVTFPAASGGDWGTIVDGALFDAAVGGNQIYQGPLTTPRDVLDGEVFAVPTGDLTIDET